MLGSPIYKWFDELSLCSAMKALSEVDIVEHICGITLKMFNTISLTPSVGMQLNSNLVLGSRFYHTLAEAMDADFKYSDKLMRKVYQRVRANAFCLDSSIEPTRLIWLIEHVPVIFAYSKLLDDYGAAATTAALREDLLIDEEIRDVVAILRSSDEKTEYPFPLDLIPKNTLFAYLCGAQVDLTSFSMDDLFSPLNALRPQLQKKALRAFSLLGSPHKKYLLDMALSDDLSAYIEKDIQIWIKRLKLQSNLQLLSNVNHFPTFRDQSIEGHLKDIMMIRTFLRHVDELVGLSLRDDTLPATQVTLILIKTTVTCKPLGITGHWFTISSLKAELKNIGNFLTIQPVERLLNVFTPEDFYPVFVVKTIYHHVFEHDQSKAFSFLAKNMSALPLDWTIRNEFLKDIDVPLEHITSFKNYLKHHYELTMPTMHVS